MKGIILAAGEGKRLWPFTAVMPKVMVPLLNRPILFHNINAMKHVGVDTCLINTYTKANIIERFFIEQKPPISILLRKEQQLTGSAGGAALFAEDVRDQNEVLIMSGDAAHNIDLSGLLTAHRERNALITVAMKEVDNPSRYGVAKLNQNDRIIGFEEKPLLGKTQRAWVSCGIYCVTSSLLVQIDRQRVTDFGRDLIPNMITHGKPVYAFRCNDYWTDIGDPEELLKANLDAANGDLNLIGFSNVPQKNTTTSQAIETNSTIASSVRLQGPVFIGSGTTIAANVEIHGPAIIGANVKIGQAASLRECVIFDETEIPAGSYIARALLKGGLI